MASITPRKNKKGQTISYQIEVYRGRDAYGKKLTPYSMTWPVPVGWKESSIQRELAKVAGRFETDCKDGKVAADKRSFSKQSEQYMKIAKRDTKHRTYHRYKQLLERINNEIGHIKLDKLSPTHLNQFYLKLGEPGANQKTGEPLSEQTILHYHRLIHAILESAIKEGTITYNVAKRSTPPKKPKKEAGFFETEEVLKIAAALSTESLKWRVITSVFVETGARRGEVFGLKWNAINFKEREIHICNNLQYTSQKGIYDETVKNEDQRHTTISEDLIKLFKALKKETLEKQLELGDAWNNTNYCFVGATGLPHNPNVSNEWYKRFSKRHELPHVHPHKFRHTQASLLYSANQDPITISKRLGHKQVSTTQNMYAHLLKDSDRMASDAISNILNQKVK